MSGFPSVAVVIAARDPGDFVVDAVDSAVAQTRPPHEVVLVDDGSTDGWCQRAVAGRPVTLLERPPRGRSQARNAGMEVVTAEAALFLDADDRLRPEALELLSGVLAAHPEVDLVHGRTFEFADERHPPGEGVRSPQGIVGVRLGGATLFRRSLWERVGPLDEQLARGEWIDWVNRADAAVRAVVRIDDVVLERRLHSHNRTAGSTGQQAYVDVARAALARKRQAAAGSPER